MSERAAHMLERLQQDDAVAALTGYVTRQRWFGGRGRAVDGLHVIESVPIHEDAGVALWTVLVEVRYPEGDTEIYNLLVSRRPAAAAVTDDVDDDRFVSAATHHGGPAVIHDALHDGAGLEHLWKAMRRSAVLPGARGELRCSNLRMAEPEPADGEVADDIHPLGREQTNTSAVRGDRELLKVLRRVAPGVSPELEVTDALVRAGFTSTPAPLAAVEYVPHQGEPILLATLQPFLHNGTEGWTLALTSLRALYAEAEASLGPGPEPVADGGDDDGLAATFAAEAARLGRVTAEMHLALLEAGPEPELLAHPTTPAELADWSREMIAELDALLARGDASLDPLRARRRELVSAFDAVRGVDDGGISIRVHGDLHLGQTLRTDDGWMILDFEGEPRIPLAARRRRSSALRDVAGMLRSFDYAAAAALAERLDPQDAKWTALQPRGDAWSRVNRDAYSAAYATTTAGSPLLPGPAGTATLLRAHELRKAVYEAGYELGHRPSWLGIPLRFLLAGGET